MRNILIFSVLLMIVSLVDDSGGILQPFDFDEIIWGVLGGSWAIAVLDYLRTLFVEFRNTNWGQ